MIESDSDRRQRPARPRPNFGRCCQSHVRNGRYGASIKEIHQPISGGHVLAAWRLVKQRDSSVGQSLSDLRYGAGEGTFGEIRGCDAAATEHWQRPANVLRLDQQPRPTCQGLGTLGILARGTANSKSLLLRCHGLPWPFRSAVLPHIRLPFRPGSPRLRPEWKSVSGFPPHPYPPLYASISGLRSHAVIPDIRRLLCAPVTPTVRSCLVRCAMRAPEMSYSPAYHQGRDAVGPTRSPLPSPPEPGHSGPPHSSSEWTGFDVSPRHSGPRGPHAYSPEASRRASRVDDDPAVTRVVVSPGATHKEERRSRGSWADQPSLMSGDHSSSRTPKRSAPETAPVDYSQDALLMLVSLISAA